MTETQRKEVLSVSYLNAVCAYAGIAMERQQYDDDGVDVVLKKDIPLPLSEDLFMARMHVQLKSTSQNIADDKTNIHYPLKVKNYNDFTKLSHYPKILCVLVLPGLEKDWLNVTADELVLRKCMYWLKADWTEPSQNNETKTVCIPKNNIVTPEAMMALFRKECEKLQVKG